MILLIAILGVYVVVVQFLSFYGYELCGQRRGRHKKECRNAACALAHKCPYNTVYLDD